MGGQYKKAGRDIINTRLAFQGNKMSRLNWSSCIVLVGYLLMFGLSALPVTEQASRSKEVKAVSVLEVTKKHGEKSEEKPPELSADVIDSKAHNTEVQQVVLTDCEQLEQELQKYDWDSSLMLAIAKAESSCRANAVGDTSIKYVQDGREYGYSVGLFQIRILPGREHCDTFDIATNVKCAYDIYRGQGLRAWSVFLNGRYRDYL